MFIQISSQILLASTTTSLWLIHPLEHALFYQKWISIGPMLDASIGPILSQFWPIKACLLGYFLWIMCGIYLKGVSPWAAATPRFIYSHTTI